MKTIPVLILIPLALVAACGGTQPGETAGASARDVSETPLTFGWGPARRATVRETELRKGKVTVYQYDIEFSGLSGSADYLLEFSNFRLAEFEGAPVTAEIEESQKIKTAVRSMIPPMKITAEGKYVGPPEDFSMKQMVAEMRKGVFRDIPETEWRESELLLTSSGYESAAILGCSDVWQAWAEAWLGFSGKQGEVVESRAEMRLANGQMSPVRIQMQNDGPDPQFPHALRISMRTIQSGPELTAFIKGTLQSTMSAATDSDSQSNAAIQNHIDAIESVTKTVDAAAAIQPDTLLPLMAKFKRTTTTATRDGKEKTTIYANHYLFDWY